MCALFSGHGARLWSLSTLAIHILFFNKRCENCVNRFIHVQWRACTSIPHPHSLPSHTHTTYIHTNRWWETVEVMLWLPLFLVRLFSPKHHQWAGVLGCRFPCIYSTVQEDDSNHDVCHVCITDMYMHACAHTCTHTHTLSHSFARTHTHIRTHVHVATCFTVASVI